MQYPATVLYYSKKRQAAPDLIQGWAASHSMALSLVSDLEEMRWAVLRNLPHMVIVDVDFSKAVAAELCQILRADPYTAVIPILCYTTENEAGGATAWFQSGADEVISPVLDKAEQLSRIDSLLERTRRNVSVHPTTMLPGTPEITKEISKRIAAGDEFAVCYADLDHFKEYNDRYNYQNGDRIIYLVSRILRDVVTGMSSDGGFTGHIGGDDFIYIVLTEDMPEICKEILSIFDTLIPLQYSEQDKAAGYFLGEDRRGQLHKVPLMTLSIGVVTSGQRSFDHPARVGALATEMKAYAKSLPGSVYVIDRRRDLKPATQESKSESSS